ncbi:MAG: BCD family MFS transporter [Pseudomonadota bacterium]
MRINALTRRLLPSGALLGLMPYAQAVQGELPLRRLARLSLFQLSVGMAAVLLTGTLNRVLVIELSQPAWLVSVMVAIPLTFAPLRALIGFRSDQYRSLMGWRRVPFIWGGTLAQFGGLAIMPFALLILSDPGDAPIYLGPAAAALAFLLVGAGMHTSQTAGLALASDLVSEKTRPSVVALLYIMLLVGTIGSAMAFALLLSDFSNLRLIQVIQGAAVVTLVLNTIALWRQESLQPSLTDPSRARPQFRQSWHDFLEQPKVKRLLLSIGLGTAAFNMQDILLEPYGGEILGMSVSGTTGLSALWGAGMLLAFLSSSRFLTRGVDPKRISGYGLALGLLAFSCVILAAPFGSLGLFLVGTFSIGLGGGFFALGTLTAAMEVGTSDQRGLALGAWGAIQATSAGVAIALGGSLRDLVGYHAVQGTLGPALNDPSTGYSFVYHFEIFLLFAALVALGPIVQSTARSQRQLALHEFPS